MITPPHSCNLLFGYLTAVETADYGFFGGYLIVSPLGRPLEFHCTAPVRPSRAQQILYGPTLEPYLLGEQISCALAKAAKLTPAVVFTDCEAVLHARSLFNTPIALVLAGDDEHPMNLSGDFVFGTCRLRLPAGYERDERTVLDALSQLSPNVELIEPFARIRDAISEAQRISGRGTDAYDDAA